MLMSHGGFPKIGDPNIAPSYSTLNSNDPYYKDPKVRYPNFRKVPHGLVKETES